MPHRDRAADLGPIEKGHLSARKLTRGMILQQLAWARFVLALAYAHSGTRGPPCTWGMRAP